MQASPRYSQTNRWQRPAVEVPKDGWTAIVVGGGPAGSTAALHLAGAGCRVLMLERAEYPRDKACGDLLIPDTLAALRRGGLYDRVAAEARPVDRALVSSPSRIEWGIPGEFLLLGRERFDELLAEAASDRGAVVAHGRVVGLRSSDDGVAVDVAGIEDPFHARFAVLATGSDVSLLDELGMLQQPAPTAVAVRAYVRSPVRLEELFISFDRAIVPGYAWAFPLPGMEYNVGVGVLHDPDEPARHDLRQLFDTFCREVPAVRRLMSEAEDVGPLRGARLRCGLRGARAAGGNILAVGEQISTTYPFTGEGIGKAMETGEMAADAIAAAAHGDPEALAAYGADVETSLRPRYEGYATAQRWLSRPWLNDLVSWRIQKGRFLQSAAAGMVAETVDPARIFSWRGLMRSLVG